MTTTKAKLLTADDLLRLYSKGIRGELIRGELYETMSAGVTHGKIVINLGSELRYFVKPRRLGSLMASDTGIILERNPDTVREPDIAFISAAKMPLGIDIPGYSEAVPDLVVEIASPNDSRREVDDKVQMWLSYGVRLVWAIYPTTRTVESHPQHGAPTLLTALDTLDGGEVLPGFTCKLSDIFDD